MKKNIINLIANLALVVLTWGMLLLPIFKVNDLKMILLVVFSLYALIKFTSFILTKKDLDYENLGVSLTSILAFISLFMIDFKTKNLLLIFLIWMGLTSFIKLKKVDYYHDNKDKMWILKLFLLFIFITSGLLTGLNLFYETTILVSLSYFFLINGITDVTEDIVLLIIGEEKCK